MLETGIKAPEFTLKNQDGEEVSLKDFRGKKVILYFYPKDNTPGCTTQACSFGDRYPQIQEKGAVVLGVSKDSVASHKKFAEKYHLPLRFWRIRSWRSSRHTMYGRKKICTGKRLWV